MALTSLDILKIVDDYFHSLLRHPIDHRIYNANSCCRGMTCPWLRSLLQEVVERILLAVVPQTRLELRWNLASEAVVQELDHTPVEMPLHARQSVTFIGINL